MVNPFDGLSYADLCGRRKDYAKVMHAAVALKKNAERQLHLIGEAMKRLEPDEVEVLTSDHAVIRFLERVEGVDIDAIRQEVGRRAKAGNPIGGDKIVGYDGMIYVVNGDNHVVTVMPSAEVIEEAEKRTQEMRSATRSGKQMRRIKRQRGSVELLKECVK